MQSSRRYSSRRERDAEQTLFARVCLALLGVLFLALPLAMAYGRVDQWPVWGWCVILALLLLGISLIAVAVGGADQTVAKWTSHGGTAEAGIVFLVLLPLAIPITMLLQRWHHRR